MLCTVSIFYKRRHDTIVVEIHCTALNKKRMLFFMEYTPSKVGFIWQSIYNKTLRFFFPISILEVIPLALE
jgi:hypothetical protein